MKISTERSIRHSHLVLLLGLCAACSGGGGSSGPPEPQLSGTILFLPDSSTVPAPALNAVRHTSRGFNGSIDRAQSIGQITAGVPVRIEGSLRSEEMLLKTSLRSEQLSPRSSQMLPLPGQMPPSFGQMPPSSGQMSPSSGQKSPSSGQTSQRSGGTSATADAGDLESFAFVAPERVEVRASLTGVGARDAELLVYDPVALQYVAHGTNGEARFFAHGACDLVVRGSELGGAYTLEISASPASVAVLGAESDRPAYLGDIAVGEEIRAELDSPISGTGPQRVIVTVPELLELETACSGAEISIRDVTVADRSRAIARGSDAMGGVLVPALTLVEIDVEPRSPSAQGSLELIIGARASSSNASADRLASTAPASIAPLEQESAFDRRAKAGAFFGSPRAEFVAGEVLVAAKPGADIEVDIARRGARSADAIPNGARLLAFDLASGMDAVQRSRATIALAKSFDSSPRVRYGELNLVRRASGGPNDTYYPLQWHYPLIHLPEAWSITTGSDNVIVAILDTGQTNHPDLVNRQIAGYDFISSPASAGDGDGIDADPTDVGDGNPPQPSSFHGTHVAGTIGAETNNASGVAGVTWFTKLMHLRVLGKQGGTDFDIANAVRYAAGLANNSQTLPPQRANVINMSLGGPGSTQTMQDAVTAARNQGLVLFAAAGNENSSEASFPAAYDGVVSVAAVDINANRAPYSNFGPTIDICAPGGNSSVDLDHDGHPDGVLSTLMDDSTNPFTPIYAFYDGTSMATPHVAGVAALMLAVNPALTPSQIEAMLTSTATDLGAPGRDDLYGYGLVNAFAAVAMASGATGPSHPLLSLSLSSMSFGQHQADLSSGVMNIGNGTLDVTGASVTTSSGGNWLSAATVPSSDPSATNVSAVDVHVDRSGLADDVYTGTVVVDSSNGGSQTIEVTMVVQNTVPTQNVDLFVLAVDATTFETKAQSVVNPSTGLGWGMFNLPPGSYVLVCGSDDNHNNTICDDGDVYCGLYPTLNDPQAVGVGSNPIGSLDFTVSANGMTALDRGRMLKLIRGKGLRLVH